MILWNIFFVFFRIGFCAFGGAYSFLPLLEKELIESYGWLTKEEFLDVLGVVKVFPGAISIKYATYTGYKIAGFPGAVMANLGNIVAPVLFIMFAFGLYAKYKDFPRVKNAFSMIQLVVFAMIIAAAFQVVNVNNFLNIKSLAVIIIAFCLFCFTKVHPALIIITAAALGIFIG